MLRRTFGLVTVLLLTSICLLMIGCTKHEKSGKEFPTTPEKAVMKYLSENEENLTSAQHDELASLIVGEFEVKEVKYYILRGKKKANDNNVELIYVVKAINEKAGYVVEKVTADFQLDAVRDGTELPKENYIGYRIPVEGVFLHVGKINNKNFRPYLDGKELKCDKNGVFFSVSKGEQKRIEIKNL